MSCLTETEAALAAAANATEATAELIRFAREGAWRDDNPFEDEVCGKLADALKLAFEIEREPIFNPVTQPEDFAAEKALRDNLITSLTAYLEGWAP
jgi:hypothetical protein